MPPHPKRQLLYSRVRLSSIYTEPQQHNKHWLAPSQFSPFSSWFFILTTGCMQVLHDLIVHSASTTIVTNIHLRISHFLVSTS